MAIVKRLLALMGPLEVMAYGRSVTPLTLSFPGSRSSGTTSSALVADIARRARARSDTIRTMRKVARGGRAQDKIKALFFTGMIDQR